MDVAYVAVTIYIVSVLFKCFRGFRRMLHVFYMSAAYVSRICLEVFHPDVAYVSYICCKCFIWMLHMFYNGYTRVSLVFHTYVASVSINSDVCSKCFIYFFRRMLQVCLFGCYICFTHMLQVFYLNVAYVL